MTILDGQHIHVGFKQLQVYLLQEGWTRDKADLHHALGHPEGCSQTAEMGGERLVGHLEDLVTGLSEML